jgi:hypothetical protein
MRIGGSDARPRVSVVLLPTELFRMKIERRSILSLTGGISVLMFLSVHRSTQTRSRYLVGRKALTRCTKAAPFQDNFDSSDRTRRRESWSPV